MSKRDRKRGKSFERVKLQERYKKRERERQMEIIRKRKKGCLIKRKERNYKKGRERDG